MDDVTTWMDSTEKLIDTYENQEKQAAGDDGSRDLAVPHVGEVPEEMVHVVEEILVSSAVVLLKSLAYEYFRIEPLKSWKICFRHGNFDFFRQNVKRFLRENYN